VSGSLVDGLNRVAKPRGHYIDSKPAIISDDYFDEKIVQGTELAEPEDTTRENILAEAGYEQVYDIDEVRRWRTCGPDVDQSPMRSEIQAGSEAVG
jgi:hypothetical protein